MKTIWIKQPEDMDRDELADHYREDHGVDPFDRNLGLLLEDHEDDHASIISQQRVIRHYHRSNP